MTNVLERLPHGARVALIRLRSLGDCVLTTPAIDLLHAFRPDLKLSVTVEDRFAAVFEGNPAIHRIGEGVSPADLCLNLHGGTRSALLTLGSFARWRAGFGHFRWAPIYNLRIPRAQEILGEERVVHTAEHLASSLFFLGIPRRDIPRARLFAPRTRRPRPFAVLHPFSTRADKSWPLERFLAVARALRAEFDPVVLAGPGDDASAFSEFETLAGAPLPEAMSLIGGASLFIGNDSGPAHVAAAYGVPAVVLFGASDPAIWGPWRSPARVLAEPGGMAGIEVADVLEAADAMKAAV